MIEIPRATPLMPAGSGSLDKVAVSMWEFLFSVDPSCNKYHWELGCQEAGSIVWVLPGLVTLPDGHVGADGPMVEFDQYMDQMPAVPTATSNTARNPAVARARTK
eukprot:4350321-Lingulodinium_polyedra.AAC.1